MASRNVSISGLDALARNLDRLPEVVREAARVAIRDETEETADDMRRHAPVLSGKLRRGIQAELDPRALEGAAVTTAEHSPFVIHGTSDMEADDFMTPAAKRAQRRFPARVKRDVGEAILGLGGHR